MSTYQEAARRRGAKRSARVAQKVLEAMRNIRREMNGNDGIYPGNGGAVNKNEVARRAGIHHTTLFSPKQKRLGERVSRWISLLKETATVGRERVRRTQAERAADWETRYKLVSTHLELANLKMQSAESERDEALAKVQELRQENAALLEQLAMKGKSKVKPLPTGSKR